MRRFATPAASTRENARLGSATLRVGITLAGGGQGACARLEAPAVSGGAAKERVGCRLKPRRVPRRRAVANSERATRLACCLSSEKGL